MLLAEASVAPILLANEERHVHGKQMFRLIEFILPKHRRAVPFLAEKSVAHDVLQLMPGRAIKAQRAARQQIAICRAEKRAHVFRRCQVVYAVAGCQHSADAARKGQFLHILPNKRGLHAVIARIFLRLPQHRGR